MSIKVNFQKKLKNNSSNLVLFSNEKFNVKNLKNYLTTQEFSYISDLLKNADTKKNLLVYELSSKKKFILVSIKNNLKNSDIENLGAEFYKKVNFGKAQIII